MTPATLLAYGGALFIAAAIPGPGMTAIVARALGSGFRPTFFMGLGLILGDLCYLTAVVLGLALVAQTFATHRFSSSNIWALSISALSHGSSGPPGSCRRRSRRSAQRMPACRSSPVSC